LDMDWAMGYWLPAEVPEWSERVPDW
jgi:hypothetical protein